MKRLIAIYITGIIFAGVGLSRLAHADISKSFLRAGSKVSWTLKDGKTTGTGTLVNDAIGKRVLVAVDADSSLSSSSLGELAIVIWCNTTWLTAVPLAPAKP